MKPTKTNMNRCYIICSEDLNRNKNLKNLFRTLPLEEVLPHGSALPVIDGMHYYVTDALPEGKEPVSKKSIENLGWTVDEFKEMHGAEVKAPVVRPVLVDDAAEDEERMLLADKYDLIAKHLRATEIVNDDAAEEDAKVVSLADHLERAAKHIREMEALDDEPTEEEDDVLEEVLSSLGTVIKPAPRPTQEEIDADPDAFISIPRAVFAPYFDDDTPDAEIELIIHCLLEADRIRALEEEGGDD